MTCLYRLCIGWYSHLNLICLPDAEDLLTFTLGVKLFFRFDLIDFVEDDLDIY